MKCIPRIVVLLPFVKCIFHAGQVYLQENSHLKNAQPVNGYGWDSDVVAVLEQILNLVKRTTNVDNCRFRRNGNSHTSLDIKR